MENLFRHFPLLSEKQKELFAALGPLYADWNSKINVISRKDMDNFYEHHVLHSLAISKVVDFPAGSRILDLGTGGGFPGIPLAIMFPSCSFTLCDSIGKKVKVASAVAGALGLENVTCVNSRAENLEGGFNYVVSRAVADLEAFYPWVKGKFTNSIIYLKGGDLSDEITRSVRRHHLDEGKIFSFDISRWFPEEWFLEKKIVIISQ